MCLLKLGQQQVAGVVYVIFGIMMRRIRILCAIAPHGGILEDRCWQLDKA